MTGVFKHALEADARAGPNNDDFAIPVESSQVIFCYTSCGGKDMEVRDQVYTTARGQENWDKIDAAGRMQAYLLAHLDEEITLEDLSEAAGYSLWHSLRIFKELLNVTPFGYIRAVKLTRAAEALRDSSCKVLDVALDSGFDSHDGFTRAFSRQFHMTPRRYQSTTPPVSYLTLIPIKNFYPHPYVNHRREMEMDRVSRIVTATVVERPARKMLLLRSKKAICYETYCEEVGYAWQGILGSVPEKLDNPALVTLPPYLVREGTSETAGAVEVPQDYDKALPEGYELIDLPAGKVMFFQGMPFADGQDYPEAIGIVYEASAQYKPEAYGYRYAPDTAPQYNFGADAEVGARMGIPVMSL